MIRKSVVLPLAPAAAFELFTRRIDEWWPADRRHFQNRPSQIFMLRSGRFYERTRDGREVELGRVRAWDFPRQILLDFFVATGPENPTQVEITFSALDGSTEVTVTHWPTPGNADAWEATALRYSQSWDAVLTAFLHARA
jgi:Activator of Hsp90 ATPase homolog 1-like protein